jgi:hypothetical protein
MFRFSYTPIRFGRSVGLPTCQQDLRNMPGVSIRASQIVGRVLIYCSEDYNDLRGSSWIQT